MSGRKCRFNRENSQSRVDRNVVRGWFERPREGLYLHDSPYRAWGLKLHLQSSHWVPRRRQLATYRVSPSRGGFEVLLQRRPPWWLLERGPRVWLAYPCSSSSWETEWKERRERRTVRKWVRPSSGLGRLPLRNGFRQREELAEEQCPWMTHFDKDDDREAELEKGDVLLWRQGERKRSRGVESFEWAKLFWTKLAESGPEWMQERFALTGLALTRSQAMHPSLIDRRAAWELRDNFVLERAKITDRLRLQT